MKNELKSRVQRTIVFDGVCVLCGAWVKFVMRRDCGAHRFAAMQTDVGAKLLADHGIDPSNPSTFLLLEGSEVYTDSDAALRIVEQFGFVWRAAARTARIIPRRVRDAIYRWIARHRYRIFGRRDTCFVAPPGETNRFLR